MRNRFRLRMLPVAALRDRMVAADPGFTRLSLAVRVTVAMIVTVALLGAGTRFFGLPVTVTVLGAIVSMQALLAVNDPQARLTTLLVPIPGIIGAALGAEFASRGALADLVFLCILFCAVAMRALGPRYTALGTIAMMTYFFSLALGATVEQLPSLVLAVIVATGVCYAIRFYALPDRPDWISQGTVAAYQACIRLVASAANELLDAADEPRAKRRLWSAVRRLNESAESIEGRLGSDAAAETRIILEAELNAEHMAVAAVDLREAAIPVPGALSLALRALYQTASARAPSVARHVLLEHDAPEKARVLATAIDDVGDAIARVTATSAALARSGAPAGVPQQPPLRQAIQVTVASAAAIAAGEALSPQRWYWAVLATYAVFTGTASSGETLTLAWSRTAGTALGVIAGVIVGHFAKSYPLFDVPLMFVFVFCSVYLTRVSYATMVFFTTALIALLYTELGFFSDDLLAVRLAETAIGALCGGLAASLIFPTRTSDVVRTAATEALEAAGNVVRASISRLGDVDSDAHPLEAARLLEAHVQQFVARAKPAVSLAFLFRRGRLLRRWTVSLRQSSYYASRLASVADSAQAPVPIGAGSELQRLGENIESSIAAASRRIDGKYDAATMDAVRPLAHFPCTRENRAFPPPSASATDLLDRLDRAIAHLAHDDFPQSTGRVRNRLVKRKTPPGNQAP